MFQFSIRPVMRTLLLLLSLVALCGVCQADKFLMNDTKYNSHQNTQWRLSVWTAEGGMTPTYIEDSPTGNYKVYTSQGQYQESYLYWWTCSQAMSIPNKTVNTILVESHQPFNTDENERDIWSQEGTATNGTVVALTPVSLYRYPRGVGLAVPGGVLA